jgi:hypothetical protein
MLRNNWLPINHYLLHLVGLAFIYYFIWLKWILILDTLHWTTNWEKGSACFHSSASTIQFIFSWNIAFLYFLFVQHWKCHSECFHCCVCCYCPCHYRHQIFVVVAKPSVTFLPWCCVKVLLSFQQCHYNTWLVVTKVIRLLLTWKSVHCELGFVLDALLSSAIFTDTTLSGWDKALLLGSILCAVL